jgi:hypothetical protein
LLAAGVDAVPESPPPGGFIGASTRFKSRVGVWLMPDNVNDGALEPFLTELIHIGDPILAHAEDSTDRAKGIGAAFTDLDRPKAVIHAWLAWQAEPGRPYGMAITAQYFAHDAALAARFVGWYVRLFGLIPFAGV